MEAFKNRAAKALVYIIVITLCILSAWGCGGEYGNEPAKSDISENGENKTVTEKPKPPKKNGIEELSGEIGRCNASGWEKKIDENEQYIFVLIKEESIIRIDKDTNEKICIVKAQKEGDINFLCVYKEVLYYVMNLRELYRYDLTAEETKQIYAVKDYTGVDDIFGIQIYKDNIYLYECGLGISRLDPETNKRKKLVGDNVSHGVFYNNKLYYIRRRYEEEIRCRDLDSGKDEIVRKSEDEEKKLYIELFTYRDQLCYVMAGEQWQICILEESEEDMQLFSLEKDQIWCQDRIISYDEKSLYYVYEQEEQSWLCCYDDGKKFEMKLPEDYREGGYVCEGYFLYSTNESEEYASKCIPLEQPDEEEKKGNSYFPYSTEMPTEEKKAFCEDIYKSST